ncbi:hypothetical protein QO034_06630 [Sedimentitalea sp. JM2-8]|uniref:Uncharacterized protein n=1 Tax=Sedimentitalea xiamensis TaxID=3050037 RepID=A0ABT7FCJ3_9RHOB|nr:hypothetical protein [Sedimentitalea xiamensis]MDK3072780.1 hypothetical protein [Sedimentitalea xiamensis]
MAVETHTYSDLDDTWDAANRFTAVADVDVDLSNSRAYFLFFVITGTDALPAIPVRDARPISPMAAEQMQLQTGDRLWVAGKGASALLMTG